MAGIVALVSRPLDVVGADEELMFAEIPTVYAASRHAEPVSQAPAAVSIITHDDIVKYGYRTLAQALASVPGFYITNDHLYDYIGVRGVSIPADYNIRVLFLLNGVPLNDKYWEAFYPVLTPDMLDAVDRIEVVKGPSSVLYGSSALFAIINIITRTGAQVDGVVVSAEAGSNPSGRGVITAGQCFTNGLDLFTSAHYEANEGDRSLSLGRFGTAHNADQELISDAYASAKYRDLSFQLWYADHVKEVPVGIYGTLVGDSRNKVDDAWYLAEARWDHAFENGNRLMFRSYYESYDYHGEYVFADPTSAFNTERTYDRWLGNEVQFNWQPIARHQLTLGGLFEYHWTQLRGLSKDASGNIAFVYPGSNVAFSYWAAYLQDQILLLPSLSLTAGIRYDVYPDFHLDNVAPRGALVWSAAPRTTVKLLFGRAFRAPSEFERDYNDAAGLGPDNSNLKPENITTYELVVEQDFRRGLSGRLSVFRNDLEKIIASTDAIQAQSANLFTVHTTGAEAELTKKFENGVRGFVNGTWQESQVNQGLFLNSPEWLANAGVIWPIYGDKLSGSLRENFGSSRQTRVPGQRTDDAFRTDLTVNSDNWIRNWSFNLGVINLFDQRAFVPTGAEGTPDVIPQPGRTVFFRATHKF